MSTIDKLIQAILDDKDMPEHMVTQRDDELMRALLEKHLRPLENNLKKDGYVCFPTVFGSLIELLIHNEDRRDSYYQPTWEDIAFACHEHNLPYQDVINIIDGRSRDTHTIIIDVPVFLKSLEGKGIHEHING